MRDGMRIMLDHIREVYLIAFVIEVPDTIGATRMQLEGIGSRPARQCVVSGPGNDQVRSAATSERVVAPASVDRIITGAPADGIGTLRADERVAMASTVQSDSRFAGRRRRRISGRWRRIFTRRRRICYGRRIASGGWGIASGGRGIYRTTRYASRSMVVGFGRHGDGVGVMGIDMHVVDQHVARYAGWAADRVRDPVIEDHEHRR